MSIAEISKTTVDAAIRILGGEKPSNIKIEPIGFAAPKYDWREMQRWDISESNLPPGSEILFREPGHLGAVSLADSPDRRRNPGSDGIDQRIAA